MKVSFTILMLSIYSIVHGQLSISPCFTFGISNVKTDLTPNRLGEKHSTKIGYTYASGFDINYFFNKINLFTSVGFIYDQMNHRQLFEISYNNDETINYSHTFQRRMESISILIKANLLLLNTIKIGLGIKYSFIFKFINLYL